MAKSLALIPLSILFLAVSVFAQNAPEILQRGDSVVLKNDKVRLEFDLSKGSYNIYNQDNPKPVIKDAVLRINQWSSDAADVEHFWSQRQVIDQLGEGLALDLNFKEAGAPELLFSFILYEGNNFYSATAGINNTSDQIIRIKDIYIAADAGIYSDYDLSDDFAMIEGFSGGEPLEYGERFYSPLTRANAIKSRNNIYLTFQNGKVRRQLVIGGLSYHDFEKFATIAQSRRTELEAGADGKDSLLCYLDLPNERNDQSANGEKLKLVKGEELRTWDNHEFRCSEMATSVKEPDQIIIEAQNLNGSLPYRLGFSWWQGHKHGEHADLVQSVFVEFEENGSTRRIPLIQKAKLPRFDGKSKEGVEQVELALPAEAVRAGAFKILV